MCHCGKWIIGKVADMDPRMLLQTLAGREIAVINFFIFELEKLSSLEEAALCSICYSFFNKKKFLLFSSAPKKIIFCVG